MKKKFNQTGDLIKHRKLGRGEWRVVATAMTGGGTGHGPGDYYPDGHELTLMKDVDGVIDWTKKPKKLFQSGCFTESVMISYCDPVKG